ncbi:MAG: class I SAM-dependent methyltransferase [Anaerolineae bacterium]|nr:class I SAM-dependent methyltransferase [Anaerolineae bacterium]
MPLYYRRDAENWVTREPPPVSPGVPVYRIVRCLGCGLAFVSPRPDPEEASRLYDDAYFTSGAYPGNIHQGGMTGHVDVVASPRLRRRAREMHQRTLRQVEASWRSRGTRTAPPRLLDVGCGAGLLLDAARERGWEVQGVELSPFAAERARKDLGLSVFQGELAQAGFPAGHFDIVVMRELLEHVPDPLALLQEARRVLREDGVCFVQVPNDLEGIRMRLWRRVWWLIPPLHLYYFERETLAALLERAGFRVARWGTWGSLGLDLWAVWSARWPALRYTGREAAWLGWAKRALRRGLEMAWSPADALLARWLLHTELQAFAVPQ